MIFVVATFVVLLVIGRNELSLKEIVAAVAFLILAAGFVVVSHLHPIVSMTAVAIVDIFLILKIFGSDISI